MTVNLFKPSGETDTLFNVTDIHVNHEDRVLTVMFKVNGSLRRFVLHHKNGLAL
jgi:hypothetical protein